MMQMCSQGSDLSTATAAFPGLFSTPSPATPHGGAHPGAPSPSPLALAGAQHARRGGCDSPADDGSLPPMAAGGVGTASEDHLLPLQHLLMSERGQHLSALEAKAIVYKVGRAAAAFKLGWLAGRRARTLGA